MKYGCRLGPWCVSHWHDLAFSWTFVGPLCTQLDFRQQTENHFSLFAVVQTVQFIFCHLPFPSTRLQFQSSTHTPLLNNNHEILHTKFSTHLGFQYFLTVSGRFFGKERKNAWRVFVCVQVYNNNIFFHFMEFDIMKTVYPTCALKDKRKKSPCTLNNNNKKRYENSSHCHQLLWNFPLFYISL